MPKFWIKRNFFSYLLLGLAAIYYVAIKIRLLFYSFLPKKNKKNTAKIICIGNATAGGAGKTPFSIALGKLLQNKGKKIAFAVKKYGVKNNQTFDEEILLSKIAPCFAANTRAEALELAQAADLFDFIILDDGLQNFSINKDFQILVIDGDFKFGNGFLLPAGPLREPVSWSIKRADFLVEIVEKNSSSNINIGKKPILAYKNYTLPSKVNQNSKLIAFCSIAIPEKFYNSLRKLGLNIIKTFSFNDHHPYSQKEIEKLVEIAKANQAKLITTEKDFTKISPAYINEIFVLKYELLINDPTELMKVLCK